MTLMALLQVLQGVVGLGAVVYLGGPLAVRSMMRMRIDPDPPALDASQTASADEDFFDEVVQALEPRGFVEVGRFCMDEMMTNVCTVVSLLVHPEEQAAALAAVIRSNAKGDPMAGVAKRYVEFSTEFSDGREINTTGASDLPAVGEPAHKQIVHLPKVQDPAKLWMIHQTVVRDAADSATKQPVRLDQSAGTFFAEGLRRDLDEKVGRGLWRKAKDIEYRLTLRGAYLMTWGELPPIKQIRTQRSRRRTAQLRQRLGV